MPVHRTNTCASEFLRRYLRHCTSQTWVRKVFPSHLLHLPPTCQWLYSYCLCLIPKANAEEDKPHRQNRECTSQSPRINLPKGKISMFSVSDPLSLQTLYYTCL